DRLHGVSDAAVGGDHDEAAVHPAVAKFSQQRQAVASTESALPLAQATAATQLRALAALLGEGPSNLPIVAGALPEPPPLPAIGTPDDLVVRRPDLQAANDRFVAARARRRSAVRALLPSVSATANAGVQYAIDDDLSTIESLGIGGNISVPLFNGGRGVGSVKQARGAEDAAVYTFDNAVLGAVHDVENAVVLDRRQAERHDAVLRQVDAARDALGQATAQYLEGANTFLNVLTTQASTLAAELSAIQAHRDRLGARVQLWTALGGSTRSSGGTP
ncbi:MAG: TolC family protein, partial [Myxococcota bacterium]